MKTLISFTITDRPELQFRAFAVDGTEGLSQLYQFDIDCFGSLADRPDTLDLVGKRAVLRFELEGAAPREVFGIIKTVTSGAPSAYGEARYRFRLVPWLERLNYSQSNQIHGTDQEVSVADVIEAELKGGLRREARVADTDFRIFEHELRLRNRDAYPKRDHIVQYEETDFAFISRLAEHYGIYYFFENEKGVEKVVFADDNLFTKPIEGDGALDWKPWAAGSRAGSPDTIQEFDEVSSMVPRRMWVLDYNYRLPHVPLLARSDIDRRGLGNWVEYGSHHRTPAEGETLARIRAEERRSHQRRWSGKSAVARLAPGRSFTLNKHPYGDWNQEYLVVSVHHEVRVPVPGIVHPDDWAGYRNSFEAIPQNITFRPARITPKPRMDGLLNARIDGAGQRDKAELDDQGRYRVRVPFDNSDTPDGKGSQWVRMASPFGGDGDGMHFPLAPDTEVVVACVNGDPNRPVILGAVPNPRTKSVVTRENSLRNRLVTRTGMGLEMGADGGGPSRGRGAASNRMTSQSAYGSSPQMKTPNAFGTTPAAPAEAGINDPALGTPSALMADVDAASGNNYARLYSDQSNYTRLGAQPPANESADLTTPGPLGHQPIDGIDFPEITSKAEAATARADMSAVSNPPAKEKTSTDEAALFEPELGIYSITSGDLYTKVARTTGVNSGGDIVLQSAADTTLKTKNFYTAASDNVQHLAGGNLEIYAVGDIVIRAGGKIELSANKTMGQNSGETDTEISFSDTNEENWGDTNSINHGQVRETNYGNTFTKNFASEACYTVGASASMTLGADFNIYAGPTLGISAGAVLEFYVGALKMDYAWCPLTVEYATGIGLKVRAATEMEWKTNTLGGVMYEAYIKTIETKLAAMKASSTATSAQANGTQATSTGVNANAGGPGIWAKLVALFT